MKINTKILKGLKQSRSDEKGNFGKDNGLSCRINCG